MIEPVSYTPPPGSQPTPTGIDGLGSDAFLKLFVAQLRYQNPMEPADGTQFLQQTAAFTQVETLKSIAEIQQRLMGLQQVSLAIGVVGREVTAVDGDGLAITGVVDSIRFSEAGPVLSIDGIDVPLDNVLSVDDTPQLPAE